MWMTPPPPKIQIRLDALTSAAVASEGDAVEENLDKEAVLADAGTGVLNKTMIEVVVAILIDIGPDRRVGGSQEDHLTIFFNKIILGTKIEAVVHREVSLIIDARVDMEEGLIRDHITTGAVQISQQIGHENLSLRPIWWPYLQMHV